MRKLAYIILAAGVALLTGCSSFFENPYFTAKPSGLNWVEIGQYEVMGRRHNIRLRMDGNGLVTVRDGTSSLVGNAFAHNVNSEQWADIRERRITLSEDEINMIFQRLINAGLFVKREKSLFSGSHATNETSFVYVAANIQNKTTGYPDPVTDPDLLEELKTTVLLFYQPQRGNANRPPRPQQ